MFSLDISDAKRKGFEEADFATFVSLWWPKASLERLVILAYLVIWIFTWDDEIDEPTGKFWEDLRGAGEFQNQTLQFVEHSLGVSDSLPSNGKLNKVIQSFDVIGGELRACYNMSQRKRFCFEMARYMSKSKVEQQIRLRGEIPTIEEFWDYRMGTSAVNLCTAASEYSLGAAIPSQVMDSKAMRALWDETNIIISTANDLFSLQKEVKHGGVENLVPLYFASGLDFQQSVASTIETLTEAKTRFDGAAATLLATSKHAEYDDQLQDFINVQKSMCVGNIIWR